MMAPAAAQTPQFTLYRNAAGCKGVLVPLVRPPWYIDWRQQFFVRFARFLERSGLRIRVVNSRRPPPEHPLGDHALRDFLGLLRNEESGEYQAFDCCDFIDYPQLKALLANPRCTRILKCQYLPSVFGTHAKVHPWTYFDMRWPALQPEVAALRSRPRRRRRLFFRGNPRLQRGAILKSLQEWKLIGRDIGEIAYDDYMGELSRHRLALSLPGEGDLCNRDMECFGAGTCVLRPLFRVATHSPLLPDVHYVAVDTDIGKDGCRKAAQRIASRYEEVIGQQGFLKRVAANAASWYDENVREQAALALTAKLLGLEGVAS